MAATLMGNCAIYYILTASVLVSTGEKLLFAFVVLPRTPEWFRLVQQYRKWYGASPQRVSLQQLDDVTVAAAPAALHPAELLPLPEVSEHTRIS